MKELVFVIFIVFICITAFLFIFKKKETYSSNYIKLNNTDSLESKLGETTLVVILAPWCGYCKKLKESDVLNKLSKNVKVVEISDTHPQAKDIMESANSEGFPTIVAYKDNKFYKYSGDRSEPSLLNFVLS